jgi:hypothetical protein
MSRNINTVKDKSWDAVSKRRRLRRIVLGAKLSGLRRGNLPFDDVISAAILDRPVPNKRAGACLSACRLSSRTCGGIYASLMSARGGFTVSPRYYR